MDKYANNFEKEYYFNTESEIVSFTDVDLETSQFST